MEGEVSPYPSYCARDFNSRIPTSSAYWHPLTIVLSANGIPHKLVALFCRIYFLFKGKAPCFAPVFSLCLPMAGIPPFLPKAVTLCTCAYLAHKERNATLPSKGASLLSGRQERSAINRRAILQLSGIIPSVPVPRDNRSSLPFVRTSYVGSNVGHTSLIM